MIHYEDVFNKMNTEREKWETIRTNMTYDEKVDGLDAIIEDLIEWELSAMDYESLQDYYFEAKKEYYYSNPEGLEDMLGYKQEIQDAGIVLVLDEEARELARQQDNE